VNVASVMRLVRWRQQCARDHEQGGHRARCDQPPGEAFARASDEDGCTTSARSQAVPSRACACV
jgi:hypothetical protein